MSKSTKDAVEVDEAPPWKTGFEDYTEELTASAFLRKLAHWGPIVAIVLISFIGGVATYMHTQWWPLTTIGSFLHLTLFLFWNYSTLSNHAAACRLGGGFIPRKWLPAQEEHRRSLQWCRVCEGYKVPRSHHCSVCKRCVLKMDHHCPWINACVGHANQGLFVRFLASAVAGCIHACVIIGFTIYHGLGRVWDWEEYGAHSGKPIVILTLHSLLAGVVALAFAAGVIIAVGILLISQVKYVIRNRTSIEDYITQKAHVRRDEDSEDWTYPYDLGWKRNVREVLGTWSGLPSHRGVWWPVRRGLSQFHFTEEQLAQKADKRAFSAVVEASGDWSAKWGAGFRAGPAGCVCQPLADPRRMKLVQGDGREFLATHATRYWVYLVPREAPDAPRGWAPRRFVRRVNPAPRPPACDDASESAQGDSRPTNGEVRRRRQNSGGEQ